MFCIHCGKQLNENEKFCSECGNKVGGDNDDTQNIEKPVLIAADVEESSGEVVDSVESDVSVENDIVIPSVDDSMFSTIDGNITSDSDSKSYMISPIPDEPLASESTVESNGDQGFVSSSVDGAAFSADQVSSDVVAANNNNQDVMNVNGSDTVNANDINKVSSPVADDNIFANGASNTPNNNSNNNSKKTTFILIGVLVLVIVVGIVIIATTFVSSKKPSSNIKGNSESAGNGSSAVEVSSNDKTVSYLGYKFKFPEGFKSKLDKEYGLVIANKVNAYSIRIDFSNSFDKYYDEFSKKYSDQKDKLKKTVDGREYIILVLVDDDGNEVSQFVSKANDDAVFVGLVAKNNNTIEYDDFQTLTKILDSSKESSSSFSSSDDKEEDAGKDGIKIFEFNKDVISFEEK